MFFHKNLCSYYVVVEHFKTISDAEKTCKSYMKVVTDCGEKTFQNHKFQSTTDVSYHIDTNKIPPSPPWYSVWGLCAHPSAAGGLAALIEPQSDNE